MDITGLTTPIEHVHRDFSDDLKAKIKKIDRPEFLNMLGIFNF